MEGSKDFAKGFMQRHQIPTAKYQTFNGTDIESGLKFLETLQPPYVLKADGLCAGKGVLIVPTLEEAKKEFKDEFLIIVILLKFFKSNSKIVIWYKKLL